MSVINQSQSFARLIAKAPPLVPVLHVENPDHAEPLAEALARAGIVALEVTLRTERALQVIERMSRISAPVLVGAGTVTRRSQFSQVKDAGAKFVVSPALTEELVEGARAAGLPYLPGVATPTEALRARELGFVELKFFPADLMGGVGWLAHVAPLYPELRFCPTGGISDANIKDYLRLPNVMAAGGGYLAPRALIEGARWAEITERATASVQAALRAVPPSN